MEEYIFLFALSIVWVIAAVVQDLRSREVSNWLNFSLIAIVLAYRAFYAVIFDDKMFFVYGFFGVLLFVVLAHVFYYGRVFAGGDAKLLMGLGGVLPFESYSDYLLLGAPFLILFFVVGVAYILLVSVVLILKNWVKFSKAFRRELKAWKKLFFIVFSVAVALFLLLLIFDGFSYILIAPLLLMLMPLLFIYAKALENGIMIVRKAPEDLVEGDWLEKNIKVGSKIIKKSVHGLSLREIGILKKANKKVWIKEGVPFTPTFLITLVLFGLSYFIN